MAKKISSSKRRHRVKKKESFFKKPGLWIFLLFSLIAGSLFYFFIFSQVFQIKEINLSGNQRVASGELLTIVEEGTKTKIVFPTKTIFLADLPGIKKKILQGFPQIAEVSLKRKFPNTLILNIKERKSFIVFCQALPNFDLPAVNSGEILAGEQNLGEQEPEKCFKVDETGIVFDLIRESDNANILKDTIIFSDGVEKDKQEGFLVVYFQKDEVLLGERLIAEDELKSIAEIKRGLKQDLNIQTERFSLLDSRLDVKTDEGFEIYFNMVDDASGQLFNLSLTLKEEISPEQRENLQYIDLRFGDRVFFK